MSLINYYILSFLSLSNLTQQIERRILCGFYNILNYIVKPKYNLLVYYGCSVFIIKSWVKRKPISNHSSFDESIGDTVVSDSDSLLWKDYDESDEYMANYKVMIKKDQK